MAKDKTKNKAKVPKSVPNKHLHARISFLQQAATFLAVQQISKPAVEPHSYATETVDMDWEPEHAANSTTEITRDKKPRPEGLEHQGLPSHLSSHLRQVARKSQIRLHPTVKRASCKVCSTVLVEGHSRSKYVENLSRGGKKKHADVLVLECKSCGSKRRFPVGSERQQKKSLRSRPVDRSREKTTEMNEVSSLPP